MKITSVKLYFDETSQQYKEVRNDKLHNFCSQNFGVSEALVRHKFVNEHFCMFFFVFIDFNIHSFYHFQ